MTHTKFTHLTNDELIRLFRQGDDAAATLEYVMELVSRLEATRPTAASAPYTHYGVVQ